MFFIKILYLMNEFSGKDTKEIPTQKRYNLDILIAKAKANLVSVKIAKQ